MDAHLVYQNAYEENGKNTAEGMPHQRVGTVLSHIIQKVLPQPLAHCITIGMYQQHAKRTGSHHIDETALRYMQILEIHKGAYRGEYCQDGIGISNKKVPSDTYSRED